MGDTRSEYEFALSNGSTVAIDSCVDSSMRFCYVHSFKIDPYREFDSGCITHIACFCITLIVERD